MSMIFDVWVELFCSGSLDGLTRQGRDALYCSTTLVLPGFVADKTGPCIPVDFASGAVIGFPCLSINA